jgi:hypothetical protein
MQTAPENATDHSMKCPACGRWFDMRDLGEVAEHIHDTSEVEVAEGPSPRIRTEAAT